MQVQPDLQLFKKKSIYYNKKKKNLKLNHKQHKQIVQVDQKNWREIQSRKTTHNGSVYLPIWIP